MPGRSIIVIVGIVICSFLTVVILFGLSDKPISYNQNFTRAFRQDVIEKGNIMNVKPDSYIAGATASRIFFGNERDTLDLLITNSELSTSMHVTLAVEPGENLNLKGSYIEIDSPFFYIKAGKHPGIFKGILDQWHAFRILEHVPYFSQAVLIGENSFALQTTGTADGNNIREHILCKVSADDPRVRVTPLAPDAEVDDFFNNLGVLRYSKPLNSVIYTFFFSNQYLVLDTSLTLRTKGNTIDTVSLAQLKPVEVAEGRYSLASTSSFVNNNAQVYSKWLFIHSNLMAVNETREVFDHMSVIDVYDIEANRYQFSFYIPEHSDIKMENFRVFGDRLIVVYNQHAVNYSLNKTPFEMSGI